MHIKIMVQQNSINPAHLIFRYLRKVLPRPEDSPSVTFGARTDFMTVFGYVAITEPIKLL
jgi:hypothetical protein